MARHRAPSRTRRVLVPAAAAAVLTTVLGVGGPLAFADATAPTNGGNGAGSSGQCTGPAAERPTSCQSPGGVSDN